MSKRIIHQVNIGDKFGKWTVIGPAYIPEGKDRKHHLCECSCELHTQRAVMVRSLLKGRSTKCGCKKPVEIGDVFERLTIIGFEERNKHGRPMWQVKCVCGTEKTVNGADVLAGKIKSCGCLHDELAAERRTTHGLSKTKEYGNAWRRENRKKNGDKLRAKARAYFADNRDRANGWSRKYHKHNPEISAALNTQRRATKRNASPEWSRDKTKLKVQYLYKFAKTLEDASDYEFHIDHIVPLKGRTDLQQASGLHVWYNLQLMLASENISKGNREWPNMW